MGTFNFRIFSFPVVGMVAVFAAVLGGRGGAAPTCPADTTYQSCELGGDGSVSCATPAGQLCPDPTGDTRYAALSSMAPA